MNDKYGMNISYDIVRRAAKERGMAFKKTKIVPMLKEGNKRDLRAYYKYWVNSNMKTFIFSDE